MTKVAIAVPKKLLFMFEEYTKIHSATSFVTIASVFDNEEHVNLWTLRIKI